ncbi:MAG TPA: 30S ribosomal protein S18 [Acidimicrobiia bacterium]|nr:30S ribosomal protein S18 [Acidimicrobiia bacterium]
MARKKTQERNRRRRGGAAELRRTKKKVCQFCKDPSVQIDWKDVALLRKFMSDRAKIRSRRVTGNCPLHQREVARAIKNAREMALLPYVATK